MQAQRDADARRYLPEAAIRARIEAMAPAGTTVERVEVREGKVHIRYSAPVADMDTLLGRIAGASRNPDAPKDVVRGGTSSDLSRRYVEFALTDSPMVCAMLSLLRLAQHPGDSIARFHVAISPFAKPSGVTSHEDSPALQRACALLRRRLLEDGYGTTITRYADEVAASCGARDRRRLAQLAEAGFAFDAERGSRPADFVAIAEALKVEDVSAERVRVMTVHQAKGLEFSRVILPYFDIEMLGKPEDVLLARDDPTKPPSCIVRGVSKDTASLSEELEAMYRASSGGKLRESLSLLYVALTRARDELYVLSTLSQASAEKPWFPAVLYHAVKDEATHSGDEAVYTSGTPVAAAPASSREPEEVRIAAAPSIRLETPRLLPRISPSSLEGRTLEGIGERLKLFPEIVRIRGRLIHRFFESMTWLEEGIPDDDTLRGLASRITADPSLVERCIGAFRDALKSGELQALFSRAQQGAGEWEVLTECPFVLKGEGVLYTGSFDRLVLKRGSGGSTEAIRVYDFKTDKIVDSIESKVSYYRPQLGQYRHAAHLLYGVPMEHIRAFLVFTSKACIVEVTE